MSELPLKSDIDLSGLTSLRVPSPEDVGNEQVYAFEDMLAYREFCERAKAAGYNFPNCLSGVDMNFGLRSVLHLRRLSDMHEITIWADVPYSKPFVPSVCDLWGGVEWFERESYDLVGIHYDQIAGYKHPDHRRILLEDDWTIHPLQRRYDTGGYIKPEWLAQDWPDYEALAREKEEARLKAIEDAKQRAEAARAKAAKAAQATKEAPKEEVKPSITPVSAKLETPKPESSKADDVKGESPKAEGVKGESPKAESSKTQSTETDGVKGESIKIESSAAEQAIANRVFNREHQDDLKRIKGVGEVLERLLHNNDIYRFVQIAQFKQADIEQLDEKLEAFKGRIVRDNWVAQAKVLAQEQSTHSKEDKAKEDKDKGGDA